MNVYLAADFGGGSGRLIAGWLNESGGLCLDEVHRFPNVPVMHDGHLCWDFWKLFGDLKEGLHKAGQKYGSSIRSLGIDTWGVDFGLVGHDGKLIGLPVCYRDERTRGVKETVAEQLGVDHYARTGIQALDINSLYQFLSMGEPATWAPSVKHILFMPDLFAYFLTGEAVNEYTIASTSEMMLAGEPRWDAELLGRIGLPTDTLCRIVQPGTALGYIRPALAGEMGLGRVEVVAVGGHDTACAVCAAPLEEDSVFLSSGTWSLLGMELDEPITTPEARAAGFSNEGGVGGKVCFLRNIPGLYPLQRLMAQWNEEGNAPTYDVLLLNAEAVSPDEAVTFDVDDPRFTNPADMAREIQSYCRERGLFVPVTKPQLARCVMESLASKYAESIKECSKIRQKANTSFPPIRRINIFGGGCRNQLLNRLTAERTGLPVVAGPVEATAIGNILVQAVAGGEISGLGEARELVRRSM